MRVVKEVTLDDFEFWSGGKDTMDELTYDEQEEVWNSLEDVFAGGEYADISETDINDFVWFERDTIAHWLGYDSFDEIMERNREGE